MKLKNYAALAKAVREAAAWRGSLTGNYGDETSMREEDERLAQFDAEIAAARQGLADVRRMRSLWVKLNRRYSEPDGIEPLEVAAIVYRHLKKAKQ
jgi:hypothetical protein